MDLIFHKLEPWAHTFCSLQTAGLRQFVPGPAVLWLLVLGLVLTLSSTSLCRGLACRCRKAHARKHPPDTLLHHLIIILVKEMHAQGKEMSYYRVRNYKGLYIVYLVPVLSAFHAHSSGKV
jgi:hypothetical protein